MQNDSIDDTVLLSALEDGSLPLEAFDHRAHVRAAWLYLRRYPLPEAARRCARAIQHYTVCNGATQKFHLTMTLAFMHIIHGLMREAPADGFATFAAQNPDLLNAPRELLARHYSDARLAWAEARTRFVPPDRAPLP